VHIAFTFAFHALPFISPVFEQLFETGAVETPLDERPRRGLFYAKEVLNYDWTVSS
jgi:hypothetical protein